MRKIQESWYHPKPIRYLKPFSYLFKSAVKLRRHCYQRGIFKQHAFDTPIIVVGNITVGGTGKTPLICYLAEKLKEQGFKPGIVSRGYGGKAKQYPMPVMKATSTDLAGDEAVLIAQKTNCPMVVAPKRVQAVQYLLDSTDCNVILSDDGLQHYAIERKIEIAVIDGERGVGNGYCLPAGPLREPVNRLKEVDYIIQNGGQKNQEFLQMQLHYGALYNLTDNNKQLPLDELKEQTVHAVAGIGHPERFFKVLEKQCAKVIRHKFQDHHKFKSKDLANFDDQLIIMTEKDAVKCRDFAKDTMWVLPISVQMDNHFIESLHHTVSRKNIFKNNL